MKREWEMWQGKQDRISSDKLIEPVCEVARYTEMHIWKITISGNCLVP
jgi:hypothetical protein